MDTDIPQTQNSPRFPSLCHVNCPHCGSSDFLALGKKGALGKSIAVAGVFGAIGDLVANSKSKDDDTFEPLNYKCKNCKKKFESVSLPAQPDEILSRPCTVVFKRLSSLLGMAVAQSVWLNGVKVGSVGNGKTLEFQIYTKFNTLFVTDQYRVAFKGDYKFEAQPGGRVEVKYKRKFV